MEWTMLEQLAGSLEEAARVNESLADILKVQAQNIRQLLYAAAKQSEIMRRVAAELSHVEGLK